MYCSLTVVETGNDGVLPILERQGVVGLAILRHRPLAVFHFFLLLGDFAREKVETLSRRVGPELEVELDVLFDERICRASGERGVGRSHRHVDQPAAAHLIDADGSEERIDQIINRSALPRLRGRLAPSGHGSQAPPT